MESAETNTTVLDTVDHFVACVPWGRWRAVTIYRRIHAGREFARLRTWNFHRTKHVWYPTNRYFVIPVDCVSELAGALLAVANGQVGEKPDWLAEREADPKYAEHAGRA